MIINFDVLNKLKMNVYYSILALAALAGSQLRTGNRQNRNSGGDHKNQNSNSNSETISMTVPNDLIGCVIGRRGSKIAEIR